LNVQQSMSMKVPFGIAQIGKSFRNEITTERFIFRTCEFEQMEMEYFVEPGAQVEALKYWTETRMSWWKQFANDGSKFRLRQHETDELAHYADNCYDVEYLYPWGWDELEGIASRTNYDLTKHAQESGVKLSYFDQQKNDPETGKPLVDLVMDKAGQKGTGKWTSEEALEMGVAVSTIHASIEARCLSALKDERVEANSQIPGPADYVYEGDRQAFIDAVHDALYASKICSYAQGMAMLAQASRERNWNLNLGEISRIWKGGCIIRAQFLDKIKQAYHRRADLPNLLLDPDFKAWVVDAQPRWRQVVSVATLAGIPIPAMSASLGYFDMYRTANLPLNLTQAQRDYFGSHTYERIDQPDRGFIHTEWKSLMK
ncbi:MAG TPA: hypothetical protein PKZ53_05045, partial [Acidobacteriota bacterium]|nr:hypothetical protein [Acidobacteriota bacterium]